MSRRGGPQRQTLEMWDSLDVWASEWTDGNTLATALCEEFYLTQDYAKRVITRWARRPGIRRYPTPRTVFYLCGGDGLKPGAKVLVSELWSQVPAQFRKHHPIAEFDPDHRSEMVVLALLGSQGDDKALCEFEALWKLSHP